MKLEFLYLNERDMIRAGVADQKRCNEAMEYMFALQHNGDFREGGDNNDAHGIRIMFPQESSIPNMPLHSPGHWFSAMPAYLGGRYHAVGIKCYGANQMNEKMNIPRSILMMSLFHPDTGVPFAYMSANILSAVRTGSVSGVYAKYMAPKDAKRIAIIGPGVMARYTLDAIICECPTIDEISVLGRGEKNLNLFKEHCSKKGYNLVKYKECHSVEEVCKDADIIIGANSKCDVYEDYPYVKQCYIKKGALVIALSILRFDNKMFLDDEVQFITDDKRLYNTHNVIDSFSISDNDDSVTYLTGIYKRLKEEKLVTDMHEVVSNPCFERDPEKIYFCSSTGMPIEDVAWGCECYQQAVEKSIGTPLLLWEESEL